MEILELGPVAREVGGLVAGVRDDQLALPTPCPAYTVADLADHLGGLTLAFTAAAHKSPLGDGAGPSGDGARLEPGWRDRIARDLVILAEAWRNPAAYRGTASAGGVTMDGAEAAAVALNEVVVHGWDLAAATGRPYRVDPAALDACLAFAASFSTPESADMRGDAFGPVLPVAADADDLTRLLALMGRDAGWAPAERTLNDAGASRTRRTR
ncbi:TIGR03086 family metal-binding protein [Nocardioides sambongensis]|uniref:TIGR03086 family metal-binding protein n=1 Tax=Nocardioides sambongensis TaxID=2589074 RepID=UPI001127CFA1|nr:TIGR03086 family metal-binding protein [Nocardioides sambongensis]